MAPKSAIHPEEDMKVQIENAGPFERKIFFEIPADVVAKEVDSTYRALNQSVKLKGFRPGKVPRSILERYYKNQVENEVMAKLIEDSYEKAVEEYHLFPVAVPTILDRTFEAGKDFKYSLTVEVKPEVDVGDYRGLEVERPAVVVTDEEVEERLRALQETHAQLKPVEADRPVQPQDMVIVDFEGTLGGKPLEGWKVRDHLVEAGSNTLVGGLDQRLIGLPLGQEEDIPLRLPDTYARKELAGKEINVRLKVKEIKEKILPALDDEFARELGDFKTLEELKSRLRKTLEEQKQKRANDIAKERLLAILRAKHPFPIPKSMIDRQIEAMLARTELQLARQGMKLEETRRDDPQIRESLRPAAEKEVRGALILEKIAEKEKISVSDEELDRRLEEIASRLNQRTEAVKNYYRKKDRLEDLRELVREEKTLDLLLREAKIFEGRAIPLENAPEDRLEERL